MKKLIIAAIILSVAALSFVAGSWYGTRGPGDSSISAPDMSGSAPSGMSHEAVHADTMEWQEDMGSEMPPGTVNVSPARQQLIGVKVAAVEKRPITYKLRLYGRVVADETKIYRLNASTDSWVREISGATTGSLVEKNEILAETLAPAFYNAQNNYVIQLGQLDHIRQQLGGELRPLQTEISDSQIRMAVQSLQILGVSDAQIAELAKTRKSSPYLQVRAPSRGIVLSRKVTLNQWFKAGDEFYTIADIRRVWVYADAYEDEAMHMRPGMNAAVKHGQMGKIFRAKVGKVLPLFEPAARTLKVRIDVDNPRYDLRPDMFVDVEIPITMPPSLNVPADAVIDTGKRAIVYVNRGNGIFEPRRVKTGWNLDGKVEITAGLSAGEKVVVSASFLIDSESRMAIAASGAGVEASGEPVSNKSVVREQGTDWAAMLKGKAGSAKIRVPAKAKREASAPAQPQAAVQTEGDDLEEGPEGPYPFPGAKYLGTVPRETAQAQGGSRNDRLPPRQFEIPAAPPSGTRLK